MRGGDLSRTKDLNRLDRRTWNKVSLGSDEVNEISIVIEAFEKTQRKFLVPQKNFNSKNRATRVIVILVKDYAV